MPKIQAKLTKQDKRFIHRIYTIISLGGEKKGELTSTNFSHKQKKIQKTNKNL